MNRNKFKKTSNMDNMVKYVNDNGGSATQTYSFSNRSFWRDVKAEDKATATEEDK